MKTTVIILLYLLSLSFASSQVFEIEKIDSKHEHSQFDGVLVRQTDADIQNSVRIVNTPDTAAIIYLEIINFSDDTIYVSYINVYIPVPYNPQDDYPWRDLEYVHKNSIKINEDTLSLLLDSLIIPPDYKGTVAIYAYFPDNSTGGKIHPIIATEECIGIFRTKDDSRVKYNPGGDWWILTQLRINTSTGIEDGNVEDQISIYPNPVSDIAFIQSDTPISSYQIYDMNGRLEKTGSGNVLDMGASRPGIYMVLINEKVFKIIKQ